MVLYDKLGYSTYDEYKNDFIDSLLVTNHNFNYFVNWEKIYEKLRKILQRLVF